MKNHLSVALVSLAVALAGISGQASAASLTVTDAGTATPALLATGSNVGVLAINPAAIPAGITVYTGVGNGWDPFGLSDNSTWYSINDAGHATATAFNLTAPATTFNLAWGSPSVGNSVTLWSGANGTGNILGTGDLSTTFANLSETIGDFPNQQIAGQLVSISSSDAFASVVFGNGAGGGFEFATNVSAVPLPAALPLFGAALMGLGGIGLRKRKAAQAA